MKKYILFLLTLVISTFAMAQDTLKEGRQLFENGDFAKAEISFKNHLKQYPNDATAHEYLGDITFKNKQYTKAAEYFKPLLKMDDKNARYHFKYAGAIGMQAKNNKFKAMFLIDDIKFHFTKAAELDASYKEARMALVQLYMELPSAFGGSIDKAITYADELTALDATMGAEAKAFIEERR